jgi:glycosyltransferase involved in cell wall biosynthesis
MKIGIAITSTQSSGGIYQYTHSVLKAVDKRQDHDDILAVLAPNTVPPPGDILGRKVDMISLNVNLQLKAHEIAAHLSGDGMDIQTQGFNQRVSDYLSAHGIDLMIFPSSSSLSFECSIPYITAVHDLQHRLQPQFPEVSAMGEWHRREYLFRNTIRHAEAILVDSEVGKEDVLTYYGGLTSPERIYPLPFVPPTGFEKQQITSEEREIIKTKYDLPERFFFYPAQFWLHKNHERLIHAVQQLRVQHHMEAPLILTGSKTGPEWEGRELVFHNAMLLAEQLGVSDIVRYLGYVPDEDMKVLYSLATALAMPTFFGPTNIPVLEAWALNCPVLCSDIRGIRDQVGSAGILVDPRDVSSITAGLLRLWQDADLRKILIVEGQKKIAAYSYDEFSRQVGKIIDTVRMQIGK